MMESGNTKQRNLLMLLYAMDDAGELKFPMIAVNDAIAVSFGLNETPM